MIHFIFSYQIYFHPDSEPERFVTFHQDQLSKIKNYSKITYLQPSFCNGMLYVLYNIYCIIPSYYCANMPSLDLFWFCFSFKNGHKLTYKTIHYLTDRYLFLFRTSTKKNKKCPQKIKK
jgi:hypothetical protein